MKHSRRGMIIDLLSEGNTDAEILAMLEKEFPLGSFSTSNTQALAGTKRDLVGSGTKMVREKAIPSPKPIQLLERDGFVEKLQSFQSDSIIERYRLRHLAGKSSSDIQGARKMDIKDLENIKKELQRRRSLLISLAHNIHSQIDKIDRQNILLYLEELKIPKKPDNEILLSKEFVSSCLSSNQPPYRMKGKLKSLIGEIPLAETIPICLSKLFNEPDFLKDENWTFINLCRFVTKIKRTKGNESGIKLAILDIIQNGSDKMSKELETGLESFYIKISDEIIKGPEKTWKFMETFTKSIPGVGPVLFSDFLKNIGFVEFVKIDYHFKNEFPILTGNENLTPKQQFKDAIQTCNQLGMTPFHFDHILYQWGRYKGLVQ